MGKEEERKYINDNQTARWNERKNRKEVTTKKCAGKGNEERGHTDVLSKGMCGVSEATSALLSVLLVSGAGPALTAAAATPAFTASTAAPWSLWTP